MIATRSQPPELPIKRGVHGEEESGVIREDVEDGGQHGLSSDFNIALAAVTSDEDYKALEAQFLEK